MASPSKYIFVYGTLKSNQPNYYLIENLINKGKFHFLCRGMLKENRPLIVATEFNVPYLLDVTNYGYKVIGEIYSFESEESLGVLDQFESHPRYYERKLCHIIRLDEDTHSEIICWVYLLTNFKDELLDYPFIEEYNDGIMNKNYVLPNKRPKGTASLEFQVKKISI